MYDFPASPSSGQVYQPSVGGPIWKFDGVAWASVQAIAGLAALKRTLFTTVGTSTSFQYDPRTQYAEVEVLGGGGGGGNTAGASAAGTAAAGSGGAAGAYCKKLIQVTDAIRAATKTIVVGAGGAGNTNGAASSYTDGVNTLATGVASSGSQGAWSSNVTHLLGGGGSLATGGDINSAGANGEASQAMGSANCGASTAAMRPGKGGDTIYGNGGRGYAIGAQSGAAVQNGLNALGYGAGGGGGGAMNGAGANGIGGNGAPGIVIVTEYFFQQGGTGPQSLTADDYNRIVNGAFTVSQENGNTAGTTNGYYFADQWSPNFSYATAVVQYSRIQSTPPNGYPDSAYTGRAYVTTAQASLAAADVCGLRHVIEGLNINDLQWGNVYSSPAVLRFTAYSSVGGTFAIALRNSGTTYCFVKAFTLPAAAWTDVEIVIPAPPNGSAWQIDNTPGIYLQFNIAAGTNWVAPADGWNAGNYVVPPGGITNGLATLNHDFRISDVGFYKDPDATGRAPKWQDPDFATELVKCQRYWESSYPLGVQPGTVNSSGIHSTQRMNVAATDFGTCYYKVTKRVAPGSAPSRVYSYATGASGQVRNDSAATDTACTAATFGENAVRVSFTAVVGAPFSWHWVANARM